MKTFSITCICTINPEKILYALQRTIDTLKNKVNLTKIYWVSDKLFPIDSYQIEVTTLFISPFKKYTEEYNYITLHLLPNKVNTDYNFIIHPDGFAVNSDAWTNEFLEYDYIGASWIMYDHYRVGNGGFTLRSKKLYDALNLLQVGYKLEHFDSNIQNDIGKFVIDGFRDKVIPEDNIICRIYRPELEKLGIKFAPPDLADRFSIEHNMNSIWLGKSLGFHGKHGVSAHYGENV